MIGYIRWGHAMTCADCAMTEVSLADDFVIIRYAIIGR